MTGQLRNESLRQLLKTVDCLYEAACDPEKWPVFLKASAELFDAQGAQVGHHDLNNHTLSFSRLHGYEWSESHYRRYDELMPTDPRLPHFAANPFKPVHCRMHLSDGELHDSRMYQEVLKPGGVEYSLGVNLMEDTRSLSYFLALRNGSQRRFDSADCAILSELIPHLNRAILLQRDITTIDFEKNVAAVTLDNMAVGLLVVDASSKVLFSNATAQDILNERDGLAEVDGTITPDKTNGAAFGSVVSRVISQSRKGELASGQPVSISRQRSLDPLQLFVSPLTGDYLRSGWAKISEPLAVVIIRDPARPAETRYEVLCKVYGLTASQARLVNQIVNGLSLKTAAGNVGITEASARQYLKIAFEKMNVSRQGEMVAKVMNLPLPIEPSEQAQA